MIYQEINKIFTADFNIDGISCPHRSWGADMKYNYLDIPRLKYGLMLLTDYPVLIQLPNGTVFQKNPGDVFLLPKGAHYLVSFLVPNGMKTSPIVINFRLTDLNGKEIEIEDRIFSLAKDDGQLLRMFQSALLLYQSASPAKLKSKVYQIIDSIFPIYDVDECAIDYINRHYTQRFSIPELADKCAMCETSYRKRFKELTGVSPIQYINRLKIEKACQMLLNDDVRLQDICDFLNFYSLPYFHKVFKDHTGMTPGAYYQEKLGTSSNKFLE